MSSFQTKINMFFQLPLQTKMKILFAVPAQKIYNFLKLSGKNSHRFSDILMDEYRRNDDFFFMQIGANDGVKFDNLYKFVTQNKCSGIVVEPLKVYFDLLSENYAKYPKIKPVNYALHQSDKEAYIHHVDPNKINLLPDDWDWAQGIGSFNEKHSQKSYIPAEYMIKEKVDCISFMELIQQQEVSSINLLQIDVEGYDFKVLKMIDYKVIKPSIIKYEHINLSKKEAKQAHNLLKSHGYIVFKQDIDTINFL